MEQMRLNPACVYPQARLPYGVTVAQVVDAVNDFYAMFHDINAHCVQRGYGRLEKLMREATFSDFVGESLARAAAKFCPTLKRNLWNNGYPDLLSREHNVKDASPHGIGMEVKASRAGGQWQAHNRERGWFLVFRFVADTRSEQDGDAAPFQIVEILAAELETADWSLSRGAEGDATAAEVQDVLAATLPDAVADTAAAEVVSEIAEKKRTRTTSTNASGTFKLRSNPIYADPAHAARHKSNPLWRRA